MVIHRISFHLVSCSTNLGTHKYYLGRWRSYLTKSDEHLVWVRFYIYYINIQLLDIIGAPNSHILWKLPTCSDSAEVSRTFDAAAVLKQSCFPKETAAEMLKMGVSENVGNSFKFWWFLTMVCMNIAIEWELLKYCNLFSRHTHTCLGQLMIRNDEIVHRSQELFWGHDWWTWEDFGRESEEDIPQLAGWFIHHEPLSTPNSRIICHNFI